MEIAHFAILKLIKIIHAGLVTYVCAMLLYYKRGSRAETYTKMKLHSWKTQFDNSLFPKNSTQWEFNENKNAIYPIYEQKTTTNVIHIGSVITVMMVMAVLLAIRMYIKREILNSKFLVWFWIFFWIRVFRRWVCWVQWGKVRYVCLVLGCPTKWRTARHLGI